MGKRSTGSFAFRRWGLWGWESESLKVAVCATAMCAAAHVGATEIANPDMLVPGDSRARLEFTVTIDGSAEQSKPKMGAFEQWSTRRTLHVAVDMVADRPSQTSAIDQNAAMENAAAMQPSNDMMALQKQAEACGTDQACMMAIAQKMMASPQTQTMISQAQAAGAQPKRYQSWRIPRDAKPDAKATIETHTNAVYKTAATETKVCSQNVALGADQLIVAGAVIVDAGAGVGYLGAVWGTGAAMPTTLDCNVDDGGGHKSKTVEQVSAGFFPTVADAHGFTKGDTVTGGGVLGRGKIEVVGSYGDMLGAPKNAKVVLNWTLTKR